MVSDTCYIFCCAFKNQWSTVFSGIVSRAMTLEVLSTGVAGNYNGALQVVSNFIEYSVQIFLYDRYGT